MFLCCNHSYNTYYRPLEVAVAGKKLGVTKKNLNTKAGRLHITKKGLFGIYQDVIKSTAGVAIVDEIKIENCTYFEAKKNCKEYQDTWNYLKKYYFSTWTTKPKELLQFI